MAKEQELDLDFDEFEDMEETTPAPPAVKAEVPDVPSEDAGDIKDPNELFGDDEEEAKTDKKVKSGKKGKAESTTTPKKVEEPYTGIRHVVVYGKELFTVEDAAVTNDEIRQRVYDEFQYHEFLKERTIFSQNRETGALELKVDREKRG